MNLSMQPQSLDTINPLNFNFMLDALNNEEKIGLNNKKKIRISFLRNITIEPIVPYLKYYFYKSGLIPDYIFGDYDSIKQEVLSNADILSAHNPEIIVLTLNYHVNDLFSNHQFIDINIFQNEIIGLFDLLKSKTNAFILVNTLIPPFHHSIDIRDSKIGGLPCNYLVLNTSIREYVLKNSSQFYLMDWDRYVRILGEENSMDYRYWYMHRSPFKKNFLNLYAKDISKVANAINGLSKKCLVLDCDNTLWKGIVGEDGIHGIKLDKYEFPGNIFYDFQQSLLSLHKKGVILALCSKNNSQDVWDVIDNHKCGVIRRDHIAASRINWDDKATNIASLSKELNLGLDSFVFVDDSQMECELVKSILPMVTVLKVPSDLHSYPQLLLRDGLFDTPTISNEDYNRTLMYQQELTRKTFSETFDKLEDYLRSLGLEVIIKPADINDIPRVSQLTQKTNQFNLSVKRYSENDIQMFVGSPDSSVFSAHVNDKFGNYGLTGVFIATKKQSTGLIDSYLLSCRILSRKIEYAFLSHCLNYLCKLWNLEFWEANYFPSEKNNQVERFLRDFGFELINDQQPLIYRIPAIVNHPGIEYIKISG